MSNNDFDRERSDDSRGRRGGGGGDDRRGGGGGGSDDRRGGGGGDRRPSFRRPGGAAGGRGRRQRTYYCPDGKCFDYKDINVLNRFVGETGKIKPRRQTGNCARCQRELAREVKRARHMALLPFVDAGD